MIIVRLSAIKIVLALLLFTSCSKDETSGNSAIPDVTVNEKININDPKYVSLTNVGGWAYLDAGSRGIILYRESTENVKAYERQCTFDAVEVCSTVDMDAVLLQANDNDCCGSQFSISTGTVLKGPATKPLLEYASTFDGTFVQVTN